MEIIKEVKYLKFFHIISIIAAAIIIIDVMRVRYPARIMIIILVCIILSDLILSILHEKNIIKILIKKSNEKTNIKNREEEVLNKYEMELLQNQTTVIMLQSQINPHFLYNTLDCIRGEAILVGASELASMTKALSNFFSYSISKDGLLVTIREELESIENYFLIQQFRFNKRFNLTINCNREDNAIMDNVIPRLVLQPIIENSISHGFRSAVSECELSVTILRTEDCIHIKCSDNGCGLEEKELEKLTENLENCIAYINEKIKEKSTHGMGIVNINRRIKLLFGNEYGLYISSIKNVGTDVHIILPLQNTAITIDSQAG